MKNTFLLIIFCAFSTMSMAQGPIAKGQTQFNFGVGLSSWGIPLYAGLDFGVHKDITLGGELSYRSYTSNYKNDNYKRSILGFSANANYHFNSLLNIPTNWDFYAGLNLGYYWWANDDNYYDHHRPGIGLGAQIGGRYYFNDKFGLNLEFGGGNAFSGGKFGISLRL